MNGTIKTKTGKGFGFISREGETKDLFFHSTDLVGVTFDALQKEQRLHLILQKAKEAQEQKM